MKPPWTRVMLNMVFLWFSAFLLTFSAALGARDVGFQHSRPVGVVHGTCKTMVEIYGYPCEEHTVILASISLHHHVFILTSSPPEVSCCRWLLKMVISWAFREYRMVILIMHTREQIRSLFCLNMDFWWYVWSEDNAQEWLLLKISLLNSAAFVGWDHLDSESTRWITRIHLSRQGIRCLDR